MADLEDFDFGFGQKVWRNFFPQFFFFWVGKLGVFLKMKPEIPHINYPLMVGRCFFLFFGDGVFVVRLFP